MKLSGFTSAAIIAAALVCGCKGHGDAHEEGHDAHEEHAGIHMSAADAARFGVKTEKIEAGEFCDAVRVAGEIMPSATDAATASAPTSGILTLSPGITRGVSVRAGQTIGRIASQGISGGDANASARIAVENAKRELDRLAPLLADGLITAKEYNDALAAYNSAKSAYSPAAASGVVTAPRSGVITDIAARQGEFVATGAPVAQISGTGTLTLRALLPARDAAFVPSISGAVINLHEGDGASFDIADFGGRLLSVAQNSAETPGYIPVYFSISSAAPVVSGNAVEVYVRGAMRQGVISVPAASLTEQLGEKFVYVKTGKDDYEKRPVTTGRSDGNRVEVLSGVAEGEAVVTSGLSFVRLAEQSTVVPEGHSHNH